MIRFSRPRMRFRSTLWVPAGIMFVACLISASAHADPATTLNGHILNGRIWSSGTNQFVTVDTVVAAAKAADAVFLGEKHDNAEHHRLQAALLDRLAAHARRPALVWEMIKPGDDTVLARASVIGAAGLGAALRWADSGWPAWSDYQPLAVTAIDHDLPMRGAALTRDQVRALLGGGIDLPDFVTLPLDLMRRDALLDQLEASHCGAVPRTALSGMANVQMARDGALARVTTETIAAGHVPVVIAGGGHARRDWGVPWHLPGRNVLVVTFMEVERGLDDPADYAAPGAFDFIWFTPRVDEKDPCARFRR